MKLLTVYQIYFDDSQLPLLEPEYVPHRNTDCSVFFESKVMADLVAGGAHRDSEYFGVVSYKLREKVGAVMKERWKMIPQIANHSTDIFTPAAFEAVLEAKRPDVLSFQRHMGHDPIMTAERFHPGFKSYWEFIMTALGERWQPQHLNDVFYCNYFAARSDIYKRFVTEWLVPAMDIMSRMPELWSDSRYPRPLPSDLSAKWGVSYYPFHPFLCERLFSYWAKKNNLVCEHF